MKCKGCVDNASLAALFAQREHKKEGAATAGHPYK